MDLAFDDMVGIVLGLNRGQGNFYIILCALMIIIMQRVFYGLIYIGLIMLAAFSAIPAEHKWSIIVHC